MKTKVQGYSCTNGMQFNKGKYTQHTGKKEKAGNIQTQTSMDWEGMDTA